jgi:hypothetical protein
MCDKKIEDMSTDEILEYLVRTEKDKVEKILKAQKETVKEKLGPRKDRAEDAFRSLVAMFLNPDIQKHFVKAGMEILSGVEEAIKVMPMPDFVKEAMGKASDAKDAIMKDVVCDSNPHCKVKVNKDKKMKKIDVE